MAYQSAGDGPGLVFVPGWAGGGNLFARQRDALSDQFTVVTVNLRGQGGCAAVAPDQGLETLGDDLAELCQALSLHKPILVGWSMGAMVVWRALLAATPVPAAGAVIIDMVPRLLNDADWRHGLIDGADARVFDFAMQAMVANWPAYMTAVVAGILAADSPQQTLLDELLETSLACDPDSMARLWASMVNQDFRADLAAMKLPTLIAHGGRSQLYSRAAAEWLAAALPDGQRVEFSDSGHAPHMEQPDAFNAALRDFAARVHRVG
jgi:pimeloyl-[acyl-carrier protein] methyl ester esterase